MPTIGVSIAVPDPYGRQLQQYRVALGDETARLIPSHITLLPPYDVAEEELTEVEEHLSKAAAQIEPFRVHLRGTGTFRPVSPVVFVVVVEGISSCEQLAARVRTGPLLISPRFPYHPHVTIAHDQPDEVLDRAFDELSNFDFVFQAEEFHLYRHDEQRGWRPARTFKLG